MSLKLSEINAAVTANNNKELQKKQLYEEAFKASLIEQDDEQQNILSCSSSHYLVSGPAGSGKTILAMIKAYEFERNGLDYHVLVYTKTLFSFLKNKMVKGNFKNISEKISYYEQSHHTDIPNDYLIIDEAQDLPLQFIIDKISTSQEYFIFGDDGQQLYPKNTKNTQIMRDLSKNISPYFTLKRSFRVPQKVATFAAQIDRNNTNIEQNCFKQSGDTPLLIEANSTNKEIKYIINVIQQQQWKNVAILFKSNSEVKDFFDKFNKFGLQCEAKYYYDNDNIHQKYNHEFNNIDFSTDLPKLLTYHSSKGLEFERVFLPNCIDFDKDFWDEINIQEAFFVAITRAIDTLIISYPQGNKMSLLNAINKGTYNFRRV